MATRATTLVSLTRFKSWLEVPVAETSRDTELEIVADSVSEFLERETRRIFVTRAVTRVYNGDGSIWLRLDDYPVEAITSISVKETQDDASPTTVSSGDYDLDSERGLVRLRAGSSPTAFPALFQNVTVVADVGYGAQDAATLPADAVRAALDIGKMVWDELRSGAIAASSISIGPGNLYIKPDFPATLKSLVENLRRPLVA